MPEVQRKDSIPARSRACYDAGTMQQPSIKESIALVFAVLLLCVAALAEKNKPLSSSELAQITARGRLLAQYDEAAWHATDAVLAQKPENGTIQRYVAKHTEGGWSVAFGHFNERKDKFLVAYEAVQGATPEQFSVKKFDPPMEDSGAYFLGAKAIETALRDFERQERPYNTMVLPMESNQMYIYIVPAQTADGVYPLGGDARFLISADGNIIVEKRQLHKTILEVKNSSADGRKQVAGLHTHVITDAPEDTDVFHVLRQKPPLPEYIGITKNLTYVVEVDGTIHVAK